MMALMKFIMTVETDGACSEDDVAKAIIASVEMMIEGGNGNPGITYTSLSPKDDRE